MSTVTRYSTPGHSQSICRVVSCLRVMSLSDVDSNLYDIGHLNDGEISMHDVNTLIQIFLTLWFR
jgi:hypothetical protein